MSIVMESSYCMAPMPSGNINNDGRRGNLMALPQSKAAGEDDKQCGVSAKA